ncbi:MAG: hypothetical protein DRN90_07985 [Thermoproteota archaeon]|nr:MAG: hypothetical protein DRN90_07985 [Candidatus Korarchaeota archaeon]
MPKITAVPLALETGPARLLVVQARSAMKSLVQQRMKMVSSSHLQFTVQEPMMFDKGICWLLR